MEFHWQAVLRASLPRCFSLSLPVIYTERMDAEGLCRKLLLTPPDNPRKTPEMQTLVTVTASHKVLTLQALSHSLNLGRKKTNKQKTHKHFCDGPCGTIVPGSLLQVPVVPRVNLLFSAKVCVSQMLCFLRHPEGNSRFPFWIEFSSDQSQIQTSSEIENFKRD